MKRKIAIFAAAFTAAAVAFAGETTADMAIAAAQNWAAENSASFAPAGEALSAVAERDSDGALLWWTVPFSGGGAAIVAPDTRIEPIIAVLPAYDGPIPEGHPLRVMLTLDMRKRLNVLGAEGTTEQQSSGRFRMRTAGTAVLPEGGASLGERDSSPLPADVAASAEKAAAKWAALAPVGPRLRNTDKIIYDPNSPDYILGICPGFEYGGVYTHWNQSNSPYSDQPDANCYNYHTPRYMVCGCVATAGAAVMQYFHSTGPTYNVTNTCTVGKFNDDGTPADKWAYVADLTMIGATNRYDWNILPENLGGTNAVVGGNTYMTEEQIDLLGRATYDMGVAVNMAYAEDGSGSQVTKLADAFRDYYGFADARAISVHNTTELMNERLIYAQVRNGIPVPLGIRPSSGDSGHAVLAIGYGQDKAGDSYTRIFMGWGGSKDAWYCLPDISSFDLVDEVITMISPDSTKTVPVFGRVVTESGTGAAFVKVKVCDKDGNAVTNAMTDASGFWATRINEEGLTLDDSTEEYPTEVLNVTTTNKWLVGDAYGTKEIREAIQRAMRNSRSVSTNTADVAGVTIPDAYRRVVTVSTNTDEVVALVNGGTTNYLSLVSNTVVKLRRYDVQVDCANALAPVDTGVGAYAFDRSSTMCFANPLAYSVPDDVILTVPDDGAITAYPGTENPENVISNAFLSNKMIFMLSGHSDTEAYKAVINYISDHADEFSSQYILYIIDPDRDTYGLSDGDPSFGVFDPHIADGSDRWAFYNGRLAHFSVTDTTDGSAGVTDEDIQFVLETSAVKYSKLSSNITLTVDPGMDGIATNGFEVTPEILDWNNNLIFGYGTFTNCFTNGQEVALTAPAAVTNGGYAYAPAGWVLYNTADTAKINELYAEWEKLYAEWKRYEAYKDISWQEIDEETGDVQEMRYVDYVWQKNHGELYPDVFPDFDPSGEVFWETSDSSDPGTFARAELTMTNDTDRTLLWQWTVTDVRFSVSSDAGGSVSASANGADLPIVDGCVWVPYSTNETDAVEFKAEAAGNSKFVGWIISQGPKTADVTISLMPTEARSLIARFTNDTKNWYYVNYSSEVSADMTVSKKNGDDPTTEAIEGTGSKRVGYKGVCLLELEMANMVEVDGRTLYCVGWTGEGSVPSRGATNVCSFVLTNESSIAWLWSEQSDPAVGNPYFRDNIKFTVDAGAGAPDGTFSPAAGTYEQIYTNGQTIICTAASGTTNETTWIATVCDGWTLTNNVSGAEIASGDGGEAEVTFEANADWTLTWKWREEELVRIAMVTEKPVDVYSAIEVSAPDALYLKGSFASIDVSGQASLVLSGLDGDTNDCEVVYKEPGKYAIIVPADANRRVTAVFNKSSGYANLTVTSVSMTNGVEVETVNWGEVTDPGYVTAKQFSAGGLMSVSMLGSPYTNIVDLGEHTRKDVWVCTGWRLYGGTTDRLADDSAKLAEGDGCKASFMLERESSLVWIWEPARSPLPDTLEGPNIGETTPVSVNPSGRKTTATIANTANGWWYGLYSSTSLVNPTWTLVPGQKKLATYDGEVITFECEWDSAEPQKFFKVIVTEYEP